MSQNNNFKERLFDTNKINALLKRYVQKNLQLQFILHKDKTVRLKDNLKC
jgi:hypothetical protein